MQESTTANMVFGVAEIVAFVSQTITLEPGDLIAHRARRPASACSATRPLLLKPGDEITIEIDGIGSITNPVIAG